MRLKTVACAKAERKLSMDEHREIARALKRVERNEAAFAKMQTARTLPVEAIDDWCRARNLMKRVCVGILQAPRRWAMRVAKTIELMRRRSGSFGSCRKVSASKCVCSSANAWCCSRPRGCRTRPSRWTLVATDHLEQLNS